MDLQNAKYLNKLQREQLLQLWNREFPERLAYGALADLDRYLDQLNDARHLLLLDQDSLLGWYCDFQREGQLWFVMILSSKIQKQGWGSRLLGMAKETVQELHGWTIDHNGDCKQNGDPYRSPIPFYVRNGFEIVPEIRFESPQLSAVKIHWKKEN